MGKRSKIAQQAFNIAQPVAERMGYDLVDAEYKKEGSAMFLRLYIDKRGGVNSDDC
jgi:ribosome maturation factor RimP